MKKRILALFLAALFCLSVPAIAMEDAIALENYTAKIYLRSVVHDIADNYYYEAALSDDLLFAAMCAVIDEGRYDFDSVLQEMLDVLDDPYSGYYPPEAATTELESYKGQFYGFGVHLMLSDGYPVVVDVLSGSPAQRAGLSVRDLILSVDGVEMKDMPLSEVTQHTRGLEGSTAVLRVRRGEEELTINCTREPVHISSVESRMLTDQIAYLQLSEFTGEIMDDIQPQFDAWRTAGVKKLVLDLRNNGGGNTEAALKLVNAIVPGGKTVLKLKYRDETKNTDLVSANPSSECPFEIVMLVNEGSASASELLAAALQGNQCARLLGMPTYGKGSMQKVVRTMTGSAYRFTFAEFYTNSDKRIHTVGLTPNLEVENEIVPVDEASFAPLNFEALDQNFTAVAERLCTLGYLAEMPQSETDAAFSDALFRFQAQNNLPMTSVVDFETVFALNNVEYNFYTVNDLQLAAAIDYFEGRLAIPDQPPQPSADLSQPSAA